jgi:hypothetical protein
MRAIRAALATAAESWALQGNTVAAAGPEAAQRLRRGWTANPPAAAPPRRCHATSADAFGALPPLPQRRVVVTGIGVVCPVGVGTAASWAAIVGGRVGTRKLLPEDLPEVREWFLTVAGLFRLP